MNMKLKIKTKHRKQANLQMKSAKIREME